MIRAVVDDSYDWFVGLVAERRGLPPAEARRISDGSIYTGRQALRLKLVDELGGAEEARAWLAAEKGIAEDLPAYEWKKKDDFFPLFASNALAGLARLVGLDPGQATLLPRRLTVDGLLSVWHPSLSGRSER
jgi:protease-4